MKKKYKLLKSSTITGYVVAFLYLLLTALLFSVGNTLYILTIILGGITLYNSLYTSYLLQSFDENTFTSKKVQVIINLVLSITSIPSFILYLIAYFDKSQDKFLVVPNEEFKAVKKEKKEKKWYQKSNFILACVGLVTVICSSFVAQIGETSGYSVQVTDRKLTKAMTEEFNSGEENALNGVNAVIKSDSLSYTFTEYRPKVASLENPLPMIIVMPGFTRTKTTMSQYAIELAKRNAVVYTIDPGCQGGTTFAGYDENGEMISSTVGANGLEYLLQYIYNNVEEYPYIDRDNIGVVGHSAGGGNANQLAETFAGDTFDESIIKALYISGYIKVSAANRFKNLRCNAALSYAYYDEGAFRYQGSTSAFEVIAKRFVNEVNGQNLNYEEAITDYEYGSLDDGTYRVIHQETVNHCFQMYDKTSINNTINFFRRSLNLKTDLSDSSHTWLVKEGFNGVALVGSFIFIFSLLAFLIDIVPWFKSFRVSANNARSYELARCVEYGGKTIEELDIPDDFTEEQLQVVKDAKPKKKKYADKVSFWTILVLTAIIACLDFIPLARLTMDFFEDAASNTYTFYFPARMMNAVMLWAVCNGLIGLILVFGVKALENLYYKLTNRPEEISWYRFKALKINWKELLYSFALSIGLFLVFYGLVGLINVIFHQDFRFMLISAAPLNSRMVVTWLIYLVPFFVFYISNSIRVNLSMAVEGWSEWKVMLLSAIANSVGLVFILVINYYVYFQTGTVFYGYYSPTDTSEMWLFINMVFGLIPMMFILPILNRFIFKKTGNVYLGSMLTCMIFIMMSISASVSYIPM